MSDPIHKNIRAQRIAQGMTQEELAAKVFTTRQTISNYETGKSKPGYEIIGRIASVLGVDAEALLYDTDDRRKKMLLWSITAGALFLFVLMRSVRFSALIIHPGRPECSLTYFQAYDMVIKPVMCCILGWILIRFCELYIRKREIHFRRSGTLFVILVLLLSVWFLVSFVELSKIYAAASDPVKNQYGGPAMLGSYIESFYYKFSQVWAQLPVLNCIFVLFGGLLAIYKYGEK